MMASKVLLKYILVFIFGIISYKSSLEIYRYYWWENVDYCYDMAKEEISSKFILKARQCIKNRMGFSYYISWIIIQPKIGENMYYNRDKWEWGY